MSNNIQSWKTKKLENLTFPLNCLYNHSRKDWLPPKPVIVDPSTLEIFIEGDDGMEIKGYLQDNGIIEITEITNTGEWSDTFMAEILIPALTKSTGILEAILIYEDSGIWRIEVENGKFTETEIEL